MTKPLADLVKVADSNGFRRLYSLVSLPPNALLTAIDGVTPADTAVWTSVQTSETTHIELNSDLVYTNHSCDPSVVFDMDRMEVRVVGGKGLEVGDEVCIRDFK